MDEIRELIAAAVSMHGSEAKLGKAAGFTQNAIWHARRHGRVSAELAIGIEKATGSKVPRWKLRPDLWEPPSLLATQSAPVQGAAQ